MDLAGNFFQVFGMMAVLGSAAVVFVTTVRWIAGKYNNRIVFALQMLIFFSLTYGFNNYILDWFSLSSFDQDADQIAATLWWLSTAFLCNAILKVVVWDGLLAERGESTVPRLLTDFVAAFIYLVAIMVVLHFVYGEPITAIAATSGAAAFIIGYSAQSTLGELFAGISLNLSRSFKKGDSIEIDGVVGRVDDVNWRSVSLYEYESDTTVIYPNSAVASSEFSNISRPARRVRGHLEFTAEFSSPPDLVTRAVKSMLKDSRFILRDPPANVYVQGTNEGGIEYGILYFFAKFEDRFVAKDEAMQAIWSAFKKHDIQAGIMHREFGPGSRFDQFGWPFRHKVLENKEGAISTFSQSPLFANVSSDDLAELAISAVRHEVAPPEMLYQVGEPGGSLFVIGEGRMGVVLPHEGYLDFVAIELEAGDVFGVTALFDAQERTASLQGIWYSVVYQLTLADLEPVFKRNPELKKQIESLTSDRNSEFERRRKAHAVDMEHKAQLRRKQEIMSGLSGKIGDFFLQGKLLSLLGSSSAATHETVMEAAMAATALVAMADGIVEDEERQQVISTFDELDLLRHVDTGKGLARFDEFCEGVRDDWDNGIEKALLSIHPVASDKASSELILGICIAVSAADGEVEEPEEEMIVRIREALRLPDETDDQSPS
jgi:small-conductance mechanosensitive channel/tellurite resistance protein